MSAIYGFFAVVGGVLALIMVFGVGDADIDVDADVDFDVSADGAGDLLGSLLSLRTLTFALAFFGLTGVLLPLVGAGAVTTFLAAVGVGVVAGFANDRLFRYLRRSESDSSITAVDLAGSRATVQLPVGDGSRGTVVIESNGRSVRMVAEPFGHVDDSFGARDRVVVVEVKDGVARIAPLNLMD